MNLALKQYYKDRMRKLEMQIEQDQHILSTHVEEFEELKDEYEELEEEKESQSEKLIRQLGEYRDKEHAKAYERDIMEGLR